jgi:hypothetical protein
MQIDQMRKSIRAFSRGGGRVGWAHFGDPRTWLSFFEAQNYGAGYSVISVTSRLTRCSLLASDMREVMPSVYKVYALKIVACL